jgi:acetate kinase
MKILVINSGSSSIKYTVINLEDQSRLLTGLIERIAETESLHRYSLSDGRTQNAIQPIANHQQALQLLFATLSSTKVVGNDGLFCIGHRVVHGGEKFQQPTLITDSVLAEIANISPLAPLHNPANLLGIEEARRQMPDTPQIAVFDTAFHHTLPDYAYHYALPVNLYQQHGVRRYGFHGTSHAYVAKQAALLLGKPLQETNLITLHLGNGASVSAIANGVSVDTSMGMTPLEGLMMGTRSGDIDAGIIFYLSRCLNLSSQAIENLLNKDSGCKGICGENDMRAIHQRAESGDQSAQLALAMYAYRIKKYIGAYFAVLGQVDALVFTGGIGENDAWLREQCCENMGLFGIALDSENNQSPDRPTGLISQTNSKVAVLVIATDEELEIALQADQCLTSIDS